MEFPRRWVTKRGQFPLFITRLHTYLCRGVVYPQTRNNVIIYLLAEAQPCQWLHHNGTLTSRTLTLAPWRREPEHWPLHYSPLTNHTFFSRNFPPLCLARGVRLEVGNISVYSLNVVAGFGCGSPHCFFLRQTICQNWWRIMRRGCERSEGNWRNFFFNDYKHGNNKKICEALKKMLT